MIFVLIGVLLTRLYDANVVVGELEVRCFYLNLGHMAGGAVFRGDRATGRATLSNRLTFYCVTGETSLVVVGWILPERFMWVMASSAANVSIV